MSSVDNGPQHAGTLYALQERAKGLGRQSYLEGDREEGFTALELEYPNGREAVSIRYRPPQFDALLEVDFDQVSFLGDYEAIKHKGTGEIEAVLRSYAGFNRVDQGVMGLSSLPGVETLEDGTGELEEDQYIDITEPPLRRRPENWRLTLQRGGVELEISPISTLLRTVLQGDRIRPIKPPSVKIRGIVTSTSEEAVRIMEDTINSLLFELDLLYGLSIALVTRPTRGRSFRKSRSTHALSFPVNRYPSEPLALYRYGRSASGLPLLQFLAFYQSLEFFFSIYSREQVLGQLKTALTDPRFDPRSNSDLSRVLTMASYGAGSHVGEKEQLRSTIRGCVEPALLRDFIESSDQTSEHFCAKKQIIQGAHRLILNEGSLDLRDQVADRVYAIRCRVVHTKQDGGNSGVTLLLPSSKESRSMGPDVELARFLSERVLLSQASTLNL